MLLSVLVHRVRKGSSRQRQGCSLVPEAFMVFSVFSICLHRNTLDFCLCDWMIATNILYYRFWHLCFASKDELIHLICQTFIAFLITNSLLFILNFGAYKELIVHHTTFFNSFPSVSFQLFF